MAYMIEGGGSKTQVIIQTFQNYVVEKFDFKGMRTLIVKKWTVGN